MTLYDQTDLPLGAGFASQVFEPANASFDCRAADDFTVPAADIQWDIASLTAPGAYISGVGPTPLVDVEFFADAGGLPGAAASCSYIGLVAGLDFTDAAGIARTCPQSAVYRRVSTGSPCERTWTRRRAVSGSGRCGPRRRSLSWENPGDGFGTGCISWTAGGPAEPLERICSSL